MQQSSSHDCDAVIVNYNAGRLLTECVQSVLSEQVRHVFVVDNDSHDDSLAHLSASISDVRVTIIRNGQNLGFAAACNIGARASNASTLLFLNPDSVLAVGSLRRMMDVLESDSSIGMVGGLLCNPDGSEQPVVSALSACTEPMEILVVDDGSTDPNIARQLAHAEQLAPGVVRIHRQLNQGLSGARNSGIALAQGKYVQFLDADDLLTPGKMDAQIAQLEINPELDVSVCNYLLCDEERGMFTKTEEAIARFEIGEQDFLYRWERGFVIPIHAGVFRRSVLSQEHRFDTHARAKEDWLFWTNLSLAGARFGYVEGHWAIYRQHETSMRRSYVNMGLAWLQAGLKINEKVGHREPLFFESVVSWFEQCYRSNPSYRAEIARRQQEASSESVEVSGAPEPAEEPAVVQARREARAILEALSSLPPLHERPKISVVVPVYGHFGYLQNCLGSLANQGQAAFEIVCIDDGSPDPRVSLLMDELQDKHPRLIVHRELCNTGISSVQNLAVEMARGEFVAFLDCDDAFVPNALETVCIALQAMPEVDYLFTDRIDVDETGETIRIAHYGGYDRLKFKSQDLIAEDLAAGHPETVELGVQAEAFNGFGLGTQFKAVTGTASHGSRNALVSPKPRSY